MRVFKNDVGQELPFPGYHLSQATREIISYYPVLSCDPLPGILGRPHEKLGHLRGKLKAEYYNTVHTNIMHIT